MIGFSFRAKGHSEPTDFAIYFLFQFFIVNCPNFLFLRIGISAYFLPCDELCYIHPCLEINYES